MCTRVLPDMYTLIPRACGPRASGVHIRQNTRAHVKTIKYMYSTACTHTWQELLLSNTCISLHNSYLRLHYHCYLYTVPVVDPPPDSKGD